MSRHSKLKSRHKTKLKVENSIATQKFMLQHTILVFKLQGTKEMSQHKTLMSRKLPDKFSRTLLRHFQTMSWHNSRKHRRMSRHNTASHDKKDGGQEKQCRNVIFYFTTKMPLGPVFRDLQFQPQSTTHYLKNYK